jgi:N-acetyl-anhydromuramyl-L-alanine amidase AmpD
MRRGPLVLAAALFGLFAGVAPAGPPLADYPQAHWLAASTSNYSRSNRPLSNPINMVVIHATEGSYAGTLQWFRNPRSHATTQYVVRSSDGDVTQMVREKDEAWHSGNGDVNDRSIGIEHEAFSSDCRWFTDAMYRSSAQLSAYLAIKYLIPIDRKHYIAHSEVPDPNHPGQFGGYAHHTDPGRCWDWPKYMSLIKDFAAASVGTSVQRLGDDSARSFARPDGWSRAASSGAYARGFSITQPSPTGKAARFTLGVPKTGSYALYAWWPAAAARNSSVPVGIDTPTGTQWVRVDQRGGTGWRYLGTFSLAGGKSTVVRISPRTTAEGSIAADAVKLELLAARPASGLEAQAEGWVATARGLSSTADGGISWESVSPPGILPSQIRGIRIVGAKGWLVAATGLRKAPIALYSTVDRGRTWTSSPIPAPADVDVAAPADVVAVDTQLVVGLRLQPNRFGLTRGVLLKSLDGVKWKQLALPVGGRVAFPTTKDGWLVGGLANEQLFATHDAGKTWRAIRPPPAIAGAASTVYALPTFSSATEGVLPVSLAAGTRSTLAFMTTVDGGRSWTTAATVKLGKSLAFGKGAPAAVVAPDYWLAAVGTRLVAVTDAGLARHTVGTLPGTVTALQFTSASTGWAQVAASGLKLFATADGGATWTQLKPP